MVNLLTPVIGITAFFKSQTGSLAVTDTKLERLHHQFTAAFLFLSVTFLGLSDCRNLEDPQYCGRFYTNAMNYGVRV